MVNQLRRQFIFGGVSMILALICGIAFATEADKYYLDVKAGKPPVSPNPAAVIEEVVFNFSAALYNNTTHQEVKPATVSNVSYVVSCPGGDIIGPSVWQIAVNKHSAVKNPLEKLCNYLL